MGATPSTADILSRAIEERLSVLHTCMPAEVVIVHGGRHKGQFVDVQPLLKRSASDEHGAQVVERLPIVPMVPIGFPSVGPFYITFPVKAGDLVWLMCAERSLEMFIATCSSNSNGRAVFSGDVRGHSLEGACAMPFCPKPRKNLRPSVHAENLVIGHDSEDGAEIHLTPGGEVRLGSGGASAFVALANRVLEELQAIKAAFDAHTHLVATTGTATAQTGSAAPPSPMAAPSSVAATKVRAV